MDPELHLTIHRQDERELTRQLELRRAAQDCPGCVVRARGRVAEIAARVRTRVTGEAHATPACCPA
jgi:predicted secreted Zn-dependent protease